MAEFSATVYQNEFLPDGGTDVNAIVTMTCSGAGAAGQTGAGDAGEIIIVDTSGSMGRMKLEAAKIGRLGRGRPDSRRHLVRGGGRHPSGLPGVSASTHRHRNGSDGCPDAFRCPPSHQPCSVPTAAPRWAPG